MSDGPFRNIALSSRWKQYGKQLVNDAGSAEERTGLVCHCILGDINMNDFQALFGELKAETSRPQRDLDPAPAIERIFDSHPVAPLIDVLRRHLVANTSDQMPPEIALDQALRTTVREWVGIVQNRLDEACIRARDRGDMSLTDFRKGIERNHETFGAIPLNDLCIALASGNKRAFRQAVQKKCGIDEGPEE